MALRFVEELLILVEEEQIPNRTLRYALAGAALMDLALEHRIDTDLETLYLTDAAPLGDDLLDPVLAEIAEGPKSQSCEFWVRRIAEKGDCLHAQALARLEAQGIMESDDGGLFAVAFRVRNSHRYPRNPMLAAAGEVEEQEIRSRLMDILFNDDVIPSPRDIAIISLCRACSLFRQTLMPEEYDEVAARIDLIAGFEMSARALMAAIPRVDRGRIGGGAAGCPGSRRRLANGFGQPAHSRPRSGTERRSHGLLHRTIPQTWPGVRVKSAGPAFRGPGRAGSEPVLRTGGQSPPAQPGNLGPMGPGNWAPPTSSSGLDGPEHRLLRGTLREPYSRNFILGRLPAVVDVVDQELACHSPDRPVAVFNMMQRIVSEQVTMLTTGTPSRDHVPDLATFLTFGLMAHVIGRYPRLAMRLPRVRRARRNMELLSERVLRDHERQLGPEDQPDLIDNLVDLHRSHPDFMSAADLCANVMGPFMVGLESVAGTTAFALYALQRHPEVAERVQREADEMFAAGGPTPELYERMTATRWLAMEALRMYPIGVALPPRHVINSFEFAGYVIPHGTTLLMASSVPHKMPEYFPDPERFDIDRYSPEAAGTPSARRVRPLWPGSPRLHGSGFRRRADGGDYRDAAAPGRYCHGPARLPAKDELYSRPSAEPEVPGAADTPPVRTGGKVMAGAGAGGRSQRFLRPGRPAGRGHVPGHRAARQRLYPAGDADSLADIRRCGQGRSDLQAGD